MNFPAVPRGCLLYVATFLFSVPPWSLLVHRFPSVKSSFQSFVVSLFELRSQAPVSFGTAKVGNFSEPPNLFLSFFKLYFRYFFWFRLGMQLLTVPIPFYSITLSIFLFHMLPPKRDAKVGKKYT